MATDRHPRLLFIISNDYGELGNARYILFGQDSLQSHSSFLLPQKLFQRNQQIFGCATEVYSSIDHILQAIQSQRPDIVFLFSGYLFAWDGSMTAQSVARIVDSCREIGSKLVTSDPYLGLLSEPVSTITDAHDSFRALFEILGNSIHFYPVPCDHLAPSSGIRGVATFNPKLVDRRQSTVSNDSIADGPPVADRKDPQDREPSPFSPATAGEDPRTWLFILGSNDFEVQTSAHGRDLFVSKLADKFRYAISVGRRPMLIAPDSCNQVLRKKIASEIDQVDLISYCGYDQFTALLLGAEATFYWNLVSNSMFHRVLNGLPNFFFDPGHLGRIQSIYELAIKNYFVGWEPVCLDQMQGLSLELLRLVNGVFQQETTRMRDQFQTAPSPQQFISSIHAGA